VRYEASFSNFQKRVGNRIQNEQIEKKNFLVLFSYKKCWGFISYTSRESRESPERTDLIDRENTRLVSRYDVSGGCQLSTFSKDTEKSEKEYSSSVSLSPLTGVKVLGKVSR
jgi:hypothetical protein